MPVCTLLLYIFIGRNIQWLPYPCFTFMWKYNFVILQKCQKGNTTTIQYETQGSHFRRKWAASGGIWTYDLCILGRSSLKFNKVYIIWTISNGCKWPLMSIWIFKNLRDIFLRSLRTSQTTYCHSSSLHLYLEVFFSFVPMKLCSLIIVVLLRPFQQVWSMLITV